MCSSDLSATPSADIITFTLFDIGADILLTTFISMFASTFEPSFALAVIVYVPSSSAFILMKLSPVCSIFSLSGALLSHDRRLSSASAGSILAITSASSPALMFDFVTPSVMEDTCFTIAPCFLNTAYISVSLFIFLFTSLLSRGFRSIDGWSGYDKIESTQCNVSRNR